MYAAFPRSKYYQRIRLPLQRLPFSGMIHFVRHTRCASAAHQDHSGSLRFLDTSFYERAVRSDPAAVSGHLALDGDLLVPSSHHDAVGLRLIYLTRLNRFTFVTTRALLCLRLAHVVTSMSPRLDSRWDGSFPLPGRDFHPLEASGLA
jgi:hypothetical protein